MYTFFAHYQEKYVSKQHHAISNVHTQQQITMISFI